MNILFTFAFPINPLNGGTERVTDIIAHELKRRGHNIMYLTFHAPTDEDLSHYPGKSFSIKEYSEKDAVGIAEYQKILNDNFIDVVINQGGSMGSCRFFCLTGNSKTKAITALHVNPGMDLKTLWGEKTALQEPGILGQIRRLLRVLYYPKTYKVKMDYITTHYTKLLSVTDCMVLLSKHFIPELVAISPTIIDRNKLSYINNPLAYCIEPIYKKEKTILFVGRLVPQKRPLDILKIWKLIASKFTDWELVIVGDGVLMDVVKQKASKLPRVVFTGSTNPIDYYRKASILCMTSGYEGWGMVLTEAMSKGCVPIAFDSYASCSEILRDNRLRVKPFSIREYANKLSDLMADANLRKQIAEENYLTLSDFSIDKIVDQWEGLINKVVNS